jgi:hypothetical protein
MESGICRPVIKTFLGVLSEDFSAISAVKAFFAATLTNPSSRGKIPLGE